MFSGLKNQLKLGDGFLSWILSPDHELVKIRDLLNWKEINKIYKSCFSSDRGNATKTTDLALGAIILQFMYGMTDRRVVEELHDKISFMYFCSTSPEEIKECREKGKDLIAHSTLVKVRKRLGPKKIRKIEKLVIKGLKKKMKLKGKKLFSDTTAVENNIAYPTEVGLLKRVIEHGEMIVQKVIKKKDLIKSKVIRKANQIARIYYSAGRKTKKLLKTTTEKMLEMAREVIGKADERMKKSNARLKEELREGYEKLNDIGGKIVSQIEKKLKGEKVDDRILSYYETDARAIPKGKVHKPCEFGVKLRLDMNEEGYITDYDVYKGNPGDVTMLEEAIKGHKKMFGKEFKEGAMDRSFYDEEKIKELENKYDISLAIPHKKDRTRKLSKKKEKLYNQRSAIESKISEGKRRYRLGKSRFKGFAGDQIWISLSIMAMNIRNMLRRLTGKSKSRLGFAKG